MAYYIKHNSAPFGPYENEHIKTLITQGKVTANTELSEDGITWKLCKDFSVFGDMFVRHITIPLLYLC